MKMQDTSSIQLYRLGKTQVNLSQIICSYSIGQMNIGS
jgi:hypothetical protein